MFIKKLCIFISNLQFWSVYLSYPYIFFQLVKFIQKDKKEKKIEKIDEQDMHIHRWVILIFKLTLNLLNFLNGLVHFPFLELSIVIFRNIKMRTWIWSANSIEPGQTAQMCRSITFSSSKIRVNINIQFYWKRYFSLLYKNTCCNISMSHAWRLLVR